MDAKPFVRREVGAQESQSVTPRLKGEGALTRTSCSQQLQPQGRGNISN